MKNNKPIGIFDSGVGGLTVLKELRALLPSEDFVYLGDTARVPYGTKSAETVAAYSLQVVERLIREDVKFVVVACNTASASALPALRARWPELPILGVVEPGARAAVAASRTGKIAVLATEGTIRSGAYQTAICEENPDADVQGLACNLLVSLVEEGWPEGPVAEAVVARYLDMLKPGSYDTLVLGCTHFPLLKNVVHKLLPENVAVLDPAAVTASVAKDWLNAAGLANSASHVGRERFFVTDTPDRFKLVAERFLADVTDNLRVEQTSLTVANTIDTLRRLNEGLMGEVRPLARRRLTRRG